MKLATTSHLTRRAAVSLGFVFLLVLAATWPANWWQAAARQGGHALERWFRATPQTGQGIGQTPPQGLNAAPGTRYNSRATAHAPFAALLVNTLVDENNSGVDCSLREAITAANTNAAFGGCSAGSGADTISFSVSGTILLSAALPDLTSDMTITGPANGITVQRDTGGNYRIFNILGGATVSLSNLTVTNGRFNDGTGNGVNTRQGAGIFNAGNLTLTGVTVSNNNTGAPGNGGAAVNTYQGAGIYNSGTLSATNSTISGNTTGGGGGNSNNTLQGGGLYNAVGATLSLTHVTVTNNNGGSNPQGITNNIAGGGIFNAGTATLKNTLVAGNTCVAGFDVSGAFTSNGNNLLGKGDGSTGFTHGVNGDQVGSNATPIDARLGPLVNNGGPTPTHAFLCVGSPSPALDAGNNTGAPATDQRGFTRPANVTVDIGAFELQVSESCTAPTITAGAALNRTRGDAGTVSTIATVSDTRTANGDLIVTATTVPSGIILTSITNASGTVTANVAASLTAALGANLVVLTVTDGSGLTMTANLTVNVQNPALRTYTVNTLGDTVDAAIGNGACADSNGDCTLRAAIQEANTYPNNAINFSVNGTLNLTSALPDITSEIPINGPSAGLTVRRDTGGNYRIFNIASGATLNLTNLTVTNGALTGISVQGGGIQNAGTLTLTGVTLSGNTITANATNNPAARGGGIYNTGTVMVTNSTISGNNLICSNGNNTLALGAGLYNSGGTVTLLNATIANNVLSAGTGNNANNHGGGIYTTGGSVSVKNTLIAQNTAANATGLDVSGAFTSQGNNLIGKGDDSTGFANGVNGDQAGSNAAPLDPRLGPLANNGGPTATHGFLCIPPTSPAIDAGNNTGAPATDQRGLARPVGGTVDIGAFEKQASDSCTAPGIVAGLAVNRTRGTAGSTATLATVSDAETSAGSLLVSAAPPFGITVTGLTNTGGTVMATVTATGGAALGANTVVLTVTDGSGLALTANFTVNVSAGAASTFTVNSLADTTDANPGDNLCNDGGGNCTLRAAIQEANTQPESTINFSVNGTINLGGVLPDLTKPMTLNGPASGVIIRRDTGGNYRVLTITSASNVTLVNLTITNGQLTGTNSTSAANDLRGGGIRNEGGLTLLNSTVTGNTINGSGGLSSNNTHQGGGIYSTGALTLNNSTLSGNSLAGAGGTGSNNNFLGAGFFNQGALSIVNSTITGNSITGGTGAGIVNNFQGGGGFSAAGVAGVRNTIIAGNTASGAPDIGGGFATQGHNVIGKSDGGIGFVDGMNGDKVGTNAAPLDARLGPLASNGGPTQTHALLCTNSPAVDAGDNANVAATDQRGLTRIVNGTVDIGAYELQANVCSPPLITAAAALTRERGVAGTVSAIATVSDGQDAAGSLTVTALPPTGITVTSITNTNGNVTATVAVAFTTPTGAYNVPLTVTDSSGLKAQATLVVNVINPAARVYTVNTLGDLADVSAGDGTCADSNGACSLRAALQEAAAFANNTINFSVNGTINLTGALPNLSTDVAITGPANGITIQRDTGGDYRILNILNGAVVTLSTLTLTNGHLANGTGNGTNLRQGGGIFNAGMLTLNAVTLSGNSTGLPGGGGAAVNTYQGAGIYNAGTLSALNSTISGNTTGLGGGNSTNTLQGGGIYNAAGAMLTLANVTITNNNGGTNGSGGGAVNTVQGGGIFNAGTATLKNTLVAGNLCSTQLDVSGAFTSDSHNLIGRSNGSTGFTHAVNGDLVGTDATPLSAQLVALASNGGPTLTHAFLCSGSPALNAGNNTDAPSTDQRGLPRPVGSAVDIGAYEQQADVCTAPTILAANGVTRSQGAPASSAQIATVNDGQDPLASLAVTISSDGQTFGAAATLNGVTINTIAVDTNGNVTASVVAACLAANASFTLKVTNSSSATATATLDITVTANPAPVLSYDAASVIAGNATTVNAATATDNGSITGYSIVSVVPALTVAPTVNANGVVSITNAGPSGGHVITVQATDNCGATTQAAFTLTVNCPTITVNPATLGSATTGTAFNQQFTQIGATGAVTWSLIGSAPPGLSFVPGTATLSGTPTAAGSFNFTIRATDANGCFGERSYTLVVDCATITVNPVNTTLTAGTAGTAYNQTFTASGGQALYSFTLNGGALPAGLNLSSGGVLSGTPTVSGTFNFTVQATDANGCVGARSYSLRICASIQLTPATLPSGTPNVLYNQTLLASGGTGPYTFVVSSGALPAGLTLTSAGVLSGTPTQTGSSNFIVTATDAEGCTGGQSYTLSVACQTITVNPATLPNGTVGTAYNQTLTASGGTAPYTFAVTTGSLPGGLNLATGGALTGTPTAAGSFNFTVTATDNTGCTGTRGYTVVVSGTGLQFYPLPAPVRLLDTRAGEAACTQPSAPIAGQTSLTQMGRGLCNIPANAVALTGNLTTVQSGGGYLTLYPSNAPQPTVASTNYNANEIINNVFTVGLGTDGAFKIFAFFTTEVVVDVTGYYAPPAANGLYFHPLPKPIRLLETRAGEVGCNTPGAPIQGGVAGTRTQQARLTCDGVTIPNGALAIVGNATTVGPQAGGYLTLFPANAAQPLVASSNYNAGQVVNGPFSVGLAPTGEFNIFTFATTHLVVDVLGYYSTEANDVNGAGLLFNPLPKPVRLLETRANQPVGCYLPGLPLISGVENTQPARGACDGVTIPANALGVVGNATVVTPNAAGFLTLWPSTALRPLVATANYNAGDIGNRHFIVGLGAGDGAFKLFSSATTELVIDLSGYFAP